MNNKSKCLMNMSVYKFLLIMCVKLQFDYSFFFTLTMGLCIMLNKNDKK